MKHFRVIINQDYNQSKGMVSHLISSYLWKVWNELGVPKRLVVSHVGIETSRIYQEGLEMTQILSCRQGFNCILCGMTTRPAYLVLLRAQSSCCGNRFQLCRRLLPEDPLQQDKNIRRLWRSLQQHCQTTVPETRRLYVLNEVSLNKK